MVDPQLTESWSVTKQSLEHARMALPEPSSEYDPHYTSLLASYREYLELNELELALESLEAAGDLISCRPAFWNNLQRAAANMELVDRVVSFGKKALASRE